MHIDLDSGPNTYHHVYGESSVERHCFLNPLDVLWCKRDLQCRYVVMEVLDLAAADDGEDVRGLVHDPRDEPKLTADFHIFECRWLLLSVVMVQPRGTSINWKYADLLLKTTIEIQREMASRYQPLFPR